MRLTRLVIALFLVLAFLGSSQACLIAGAHVSTQTESHCGSESDDDHCAGCGSAVVPVFSSKEISPSPLFLYDAAWAALMAALRVSIAERVATGEIHPPPDPFFAARAFLLTSRCQPARGPNFSA